MPSGDPRCYPEFIYEPRAPEGTNEKPPLPHRNPVFDNWLSRNWETLSAPDVRLSKQILPRKRHVIVNLNCLNGVVYSYDPALTSWMACQRSRCMARARSTTWQLHNCQPSNWEEYVPPIKALLKNEDLLAEHSYDVGTQLENTSTKLRFWRRDGWIFHLGHVFKCDRWARGEE